VLRVWDVLLFEGNRVMLFRTALAPMELYGNGVPPFLINAKLLEYLRSYILDRGF
jgi:hypothetical protein